MTLRLATWNVNSIRQRLDHLARLAADYAPDILCLQETKITDADFPAGPLAEMGYSHQVIHGQKAYNGVAILARVPFESSEKIVWCGKDDRRHVTARFEGGLEVHNFYVPSGGPDPDPVKNEKFAHKLRFLEEMAAWGEAVGAGDRKLVLMGDLNVAPLETDVWNHKRLLRSVGHTPGESERMAHVLAASGLVDAARHFVPPSEPLYTWWGYRFPQSYAKNYGWRLDHVWVGRPLMASLAGFRVVKETRTWEKPSDHVPVMIEIE